MIRRSDPSSLPDGQGWHEISVCTRRSKKDCYAASRTRNRPSLMLLTAMMPDSKNG